MNLLSLFNGRKQTTLQNIMLSIYGTMDLALLELHMSKVALIIAGITEMKLIN